MVIAHQAFLSPLKLGHHEGTLLSLFLKAGTIC
jgi:hypothetical protein